MAQGKIVKFTVSAKDRVVHEWIALQSKASFSITMAIQEYIANHGMRDTLNVNMPTPEQQNLFDTVYGSKGMAASASMQVMSAPVSVPVSAPAPVTVQNQPQQVAAEHVATEQITPQQILNQAKIPSAASEPVISSAPETVSDESGLDTSSRDKLINSLL